MFVLMLAPEAPTFEIPINTEHPDVWVDVGFCRANDHLMVGLTSSGDRFGRILRDPHGFLADEMASGIYASFELWASEEDILDLFARATDTSMFRSGIINFQVVGRSRDGLSSWVGDVIHALRTDTAFLAQMKELLLKQVRLFRENALVAQQTELWRTRRTI
jgi:hypothetical protein